MSQKRILLDIFAISFLALFLELACIRWIGSEINIFAYLQNSVLVVCFLGLGIGCITSERSIRLSDSLKGFGVIVFLLSVPLISENLTGISRLLSILHDLAVWDQGKAQSLSGSIAGILIGLVATFCLMYVVWEMFIPLGRILGRQIDEHSNPLQAYTANILGSLIGIWAYVGLGALHSGPKVWIALLCFSYLFFVRSYAKNPSQAVCGILLIGLFPVATSVLFSSDSEVIWSPYQKLELQKLTPPDSPDSTQILIKVNNYGYQVMVDHRKEASRHPRERLLSEYSQYDLPYQFHTQPKDVLIMGAGSGNDVAGALRHVSSSITAVEIDPAIITLGKTFHPEKPYHSKKVTVINDDARSFLLKNRKKFDVISFGLLDSHTATGLTNGRLDHYVYTQEAINLAKSHMLSNGIMTLTFAARWEFVIDRISHSLTEAFGFKPLTFVVPGSRYGYGGIMFVTGNQDRIQNSLNNNTELQSVVSNGKSIFSWNLQHSTPPTTDDWPYLYLKNRTIPSLFFFMAGVLVLLLAWSWWRFKLIRSYSALSRKNLFFFLFGTAFLLLEVGSISRAMILFGSTWQVNAIIISGIFVMILAANLVVFRFPNIPVRPLFAGLFASCILLYATDITLLGQLSSGLKILSTGLLCTLPMFFSGVIFARLFVSAENRSEILGANLLGSLLGGILQSITFVIGIKAILLVVCVLYFFAALCHWSSSNQMNSSATAPSP